MARLSKIERNKLYHNISKRYEEIQNLLSLTGMCTKYASGMHPKEIMHRKFRIAYCLKELCKFNLLENISNYPFLDVEDLFYKYPYDDDLYEDISFLFNEEIIEQYAEFGEYYLRICLDKSNWKIHYIFNISDYETLSEEIINSMKDIISVHWYGMISANKESDYEDGEFEIESDYLKSLGIEPEEYYEFFPVCNVVITNSVIEEVIKICKNDTNYCKWEEYKEFERYREFLIFDRYFPDLCVKDITGEDWKYMNYYLGEIIMSEKEETGMYQLNYEAVIIMILADLAAEEFM